MSSTNGTNKCRYGSFENLEEKAKVGIKKWNLTRIETNLKRLNDLIKGAKKKKDDELEYIYLYKYLNIVSEATNLHKNAFTKKSYPKLFEDASNVYKRLDELRPIITQRYENKKNAQHQEKTVSPIEIPESPKSAPVVEVDRDFIETKEVHDLIRKKNKEINYLILDARDTKDFNSSHLICDFTINIPPDHIQKQLSANQLKLKLDNKSRTWFEKRGTFDYVIVMDWDSSELTISPTSPLSCLIIALTKYDPNTKYKRKPVILNGGFLDVLEKYPMDVTNPNIDPPEKIVTHPSIANSLDSFDYPIEILQPEEVPQPKIQEIQPTPSQNVLPTLKQKPLTTEVPKVPPPVSFDRSSKPKIIKPTEPPREITPSPTQMISSDDSVRTSNISVESEAYMNNLNSTNSGTKPETPTKPDLQSSLKELRKVKPKSMGADPDNSQGDKPSGNNEKNQDSSELSSPGNNDHYNHNSDSSDSDFQITRYVPLKNSGPGPHSSNLHRTSSSPNISTLKDYDTSGHIPFYSRDNKPASKFPSHSAYGERSDSTYGSTTEGLTGLKNFANNCYMNSIIQCLNNTRPLVEALRQPDTALNKKSRTKGRIAHEVIRAFNHMWSGGIKTYSVADLKIEMGHIKDIFQGSDHQDSNEFLIILLEHLHEDLNRPLDMVISLAGAKDEIGEKAWGEFKKKNCSIIQQLFYGQHKSSVTCTYCDYTSVTFEQFFNLYVPIPATQDEVSLIDCIRLYMAGEKISGWNCPRCKTERNATKKFDISHLPRVLVIALKRFTQDHDSWLHKKENVVSYPLVNLDMSQFIVPDSEQRFCNYNLYAMSTHTGTLRSGHYRAICKHNDTKKWYMFDDQTVEPIPEHLVQKNSDVYILFYSAVKDV